MAKDAVFEAVRRAIIHATEEVRAIVNLSIQRNFQAGGRPSWPKAQRGGATLMDTGRLSRAILVTMVGEHSIGRGGNGRVTVEVKTQGIVYAAIHQFGGVIKPVHAKALAIPLTPEARSKSPRDMPGLFVVKKGDKVTLCSEDKGGKVKAQYALVKSVTIPARPYIMLQPQDLRDIWAAFDSQVKDIVLYEL